jgi:hypothetical protein
VHLVARGHLDVVVERAARTNGEGHECANLRVPRKFCETEFHLVFATEPYRGFRPPALPVYSPDVFAAGTAGVAGAAGFASVGGWKIAFKLNLIKSPPGPCPGSAVVLTISIERLK